MISSLLHGNLTDMQSHWHPFANDFRNGRGVEKRMEQFPI